MDIQDFTETVNQQRDLFLSRAALGRTKEEMDRITEAYHFAYAAHIQQKRKQGEPYIMHPIAVARIVNEDIGLGTNPIIGALLHDVVEDTPITFKQIQDRFGPDVAFLVRGMTKEQKDKYDFSKQVDNIRRMLSTIQYDIRVLLIKLADRLHNMRTLGSMPLHKQMKIAAETDYFYAPLANRLGLYKVKTELENLSFQFRSPMAYSRLQADMQAYHNNTALYVDQFREKVEEALIARGFEVEVRAEMRGIYSVWNKLKALQVPLDKLECVHLFSIVFRYDERKFVSEKIQSLNIYSLLTDMFHEKQGSFHNYIDMPKANGYQALHCKFMTPHGSWAEVHIRSERMEEMAVRGCVVNRQRHTGIVGVDAWVESFRGVLKDLANKSKSQERSFFMEDIKTTLYQDDIKVYTPKGEEVLLPQGACVLDLAYEVHSHIGNTAQYARVNGKLCSVKTILRRGDCVAVGTHPSVSPRPDWLDAVQTFKAKEGIRQALRKQNLGDKPHNYVFSHCCSPLPGDELIGFKNLDRTRTEKEVWDGMGTNAAEGAERDKETIEVHLRNCPRAILLSTEYGEHIVPVTLEPDDRQLYKAHISLLGVLRRGISLDILEIISHQLQVDIEGFDVQTHDNLLEGKLRLLVRSEKELSEVMARLQALPEIEEVKRIPLQKTEVHS